MEILFLVPTDDVQKRFSGEPYQICPREVVGILTGGFNETTTTIFQGSAAVILGRPAGKWMYGAGASNIQRAVSDCGKEMGKTGKRAYLMKKLRFSFLVLGAQVLVTALAAACCADCIACVAVHAYFHVE